MTREDPQVTAMLAHIVSQVQSNVEFLVSQNYISPAVANQFLAKLPSADAAATNGVAQQKPAANTTAKAPFAKSSVPTPPAPIRRQVPSAPQAPQARAIWGYNENNAESGDLSFSAGDVIEIVEETNADWWMGKVHGKQALFPSNYVEKITSPAPTASSAAVSEKPVYRPFGAAFHGMDKPPPPNQGVNSVGLQAQDDTEKKSKFGGLKNTLAHSAAGGVGFGVGAGIGGGLVNALF